MKSSRIPSQLVIYLFPLFNITAKIYIIHYWDNENTGKEIEMILYMRFEQNDYL